MAAIHEAIEVYLTLINMGYVPICPQLSVFAELVAPGKVPYQKWLDLDESYITACDCLLRLEGESKGADREVEFARSRGIPVFYGVGEFILGTQRQKEAACRQ